MTVVVESFINSQRSYKATAEEGMLVQALTMVLEDMTREARVSRDFSCGGAVPSPCNNPEEFYMVHIEGLNDQGAGEVIAYTQNGTTIEKNIEGSDVLMTPPTISITEFNVEIVGAHSTSDQIRALVTITAHHINSPNKSVHLQTSFTERYF
jgi:hypothetical protein